MNYHLVILKKPYLDSILSGRKTVELRLTKARHPAVGRVRAGDELFLKVSGGPVCAKATVADVRYYEDLTPERIVAIQRQYNDRVGGSDAIWQAKMDCEFAFLVWLKDVRRMEPARIQKKDWRAWVVLTEDKDFGLLTGKGRRT